MTQRLDGNFFAVWRSWNLPMLLTLSFLDRINSNICFHLLRIFTWRNKKTKQFHSCQRCFIWCCEGSNLPNHNVHTQVSTRRRNVSLEFFNRFLKRCNWIPQLLKNSSLIIHFKMVASTVSLLAKWKDTLYSSRNLSYFVCSSASFFACLFHRKVAEKCWNSKGSIRPERQILKAKY